MQMQGWALRKKDMGGDTAKSEREAVMEVTHFHLECKNFILIVIVLTFLKFFAGFLESVKICLVYRKQFKPDNY